MVRLIAVRVGMPRGIEWRGRTVRTGIWKEPVERRRRVRRLNVEGDGQGDLAGHGGEQRAVFVHQIETYRYWEERLGRRSGLTVRWRSSQESLLELAEACDVPVRWSCRSGVCHTLQEWTDLRIRRL